VRDEFCVYIYRPFHGHYIAAAFTNYKDNNIWELFMKITFSQAATLVVAGLVTVSAVQARTVIQNKGSDTLVNVAQAWAEEYQKVDPDVAIAVSGGGSGTGIAAMINGTVDIANASRKMKDKEIKMADKHGHHPVEHVVGYDALAVFINKNNPANEFTFEQLKEIYGREGKARKWSDLGITVPGCSGDEIVVVSRQNNSGTYAYFKKAILGKKGKYRSGTLDMHGSKDVVDLVEKTPCAIGYSGLAYATDHVKMVCVSKNGEKCVSPSIATAVDRSYPIARPLFMYTNGEPKGDIKTYLDWILSDTGQCIILHKGYAPVKTVSCK
jgi:phosphate transport system substrate-binding protein